MAWREYWKDIAGICLRPFLPGASTPEIESNVDPELSEPQAFRGGDWLGVPLRDHPMSRLVFCRHRRPFDDQDVQLAKGFLDLAGDLKAQSVNDFEADLVAALPAHLVARALDPELRAPLTAVLQHVMHLATRTHEGAPITAAIGIEQGENAGPDAVRLREFAAARDLAVFSNGLDTLLVFDPSQRLVRLEQLDAIDTPVAPLRFGALARWSGTHGRIVVSLSRRQEVGVFHGGCIRFCRRNGRWTRFLRDEVTEHHLVGEAPLKQAVYESSLDVSFARCGGCIGLLRQGAEPTAVESLVAKEALLASGVAPKARAIAKIIGGRRFHELDRLVRQELLALDGATLLDHHGTILAAGAIVQLAEDCRDHGGGRTAAARTLSRHGVGVKISMDGQVEGYAGGKPIFEFG
jgi:hypothetical protein